MTKFRLEYATVRLRVDLGGEVVDPKEFRKRKEKLVQEMMEEYGNFDDNGKMLPADHPMQPSVDFKYTILP